ncbi:hypothetical protein LXL04_032734 [Taraxacum kok-saghyz]
MREEWRVVRRKGRPPVKTTTNRWDTADVSSFFVNNLPGDAFRKELWAPCAALGNLVDIYIAGRKDASGSFFAFVRYENPADADSIVHGLDEVSCRGRKLSANISKRGRSLPQKPQKKPATNPIPIINLATRGNRSFAEVAGGKTQPSPAVAIKEEEEIKKWLDKSILVGKAKNFDILCNFPSLLELEGFEVAEVKYGGGMNIFLKFKTGRAAEIFKANKVLWLKWFSTMDFFGASNGPFERIAWIKITGIPLTAWNEENLAKITSKFGRTVCCVSSFWNNRDVSHCKILFPDSESEEEDADMGEEDDGISDTFDQNYMEVEEGEFRPEESFVAPVIGTCPRGIRRSHPPNGIQPVIPIPVNSQPNSNSNGPVLCTLCSGPAHRTPPSGPASSPDFEVRDSAMKRRRIKFKTKIGCSRVGSHKRPAKSRSPLRSIDLNQQASSDVTQSSHGDVNPLTQQSAQATSEASSSELGRTIELGNQVGFQFEKGRGAVLSALSGADQLRGCVTLPPAATMAPMAGGRRVVRKCKTNAGNIFQGLTAEDKEEQGNGDDRRQKQEVAGLPTLTVSDGVFIFTVVVAGEERWVSDYTRKRLRREKEVRYVPGKKKQRRW